MMKAFNSRILWFVHLGLTLGAVAGCATADPVALDKRVMDLVKQNRNRITELGKNVRKVQGQVLNWENRIQSLETNLEEMNRRVGRLQTQVASLERESRHFKNTQDTLERKVVDLESLAGRLKAENKAHDSALRDQRDEFQALRLTVEKTRSDLGTEVEKAKTDTLERALRLAGILASFLEVEERLAQTMGDAYYYIVKAVKDGNPINSKEFIVQYQGPIDEKFESLKKKREALQREIKRWRGK